MRAKKNQETTESSHPYWLQSHETLKEGALRLKCQTFEVRERMHSQLMSETISESNFPDDKRKICENIVRIKAWFLIYDKLPLIDRVTGDTKPTPFGYTNDFPFDLYSIRPSAQPRYLQGYFKKLKKFALAKGTARVFAEDLEYHPEDVSMGELVGLGHGT